MLEPKRNLELNQIEPLFSEYEKTDLENSQENKLECQLHLNKTGKKKEARLETPGCLFSQRPTTALSDRTFQDDEVLFSICAPQFLS